MLIQCPECGHNVSDSAQICVSCGYPLKSTRTSYEPPKKRKYKRLPNGTGSIKVLKGNLRKPYAAYLPVTSYKDNGTPVQPKAIGYFETRTEALQALMEWHNHPYNVEGNQLTFDEVGRLYFKDKEGVIDAKTLNGHKCAYKHLQPIYNQKINQLTTRDLQEVIDNMNLKYGTVRKTLTIMKQVYKFAMKNDYVRKNYSEYVELRIQNDEESGIAFTENELHILWENREDYICRLLICMCYTGYRKTAYRSMKYNYDEWYMQGGVKNATSRERIVPIHESIKEFIPELEQFNMPDTTLRKKVDKTLDKLGILYGTNEKGEEQKHRIHDTRHTFSWLCDKYDVDSISKHMLMGHKKGKDIEDKVYGHRTLEELREAINKIEFIS